MSNQIAKRDESGHPSLIAVLNSDGLTITRVKANPATNNSLKVDDDTSGGDNGPTYALRDENNVTVIMAESSADDRTLIPLYVDSNGKLLIDSSTGGGSPA